MSLMSDKELVAFILLHRRLKRKNKRRFWVHPLNLLRPTMGEHLKVEFMYKNHPQQFFQYTRLSALQFDKILSLTEVLLFKQDTNYRLSIPPRQRLFIGLRYLATGDSIKTSFSVGQTTVRRITGEVNSALWKCLSPIYVKAPTQSGWNDIVKGFDEEWNFPNCLGAIDGKHVNIQSPPNSGSIFHNYKSFFSIVILATCDAYYRITTVDIGGYGRQSDGGIFSASALGKAMDTGNLPLPAHRLLPGTTISQPCTFVGDDAFALTNYMMKPFSQKIASSSIEKRIFNYRLSRARRIIENVFGILVSRFRIYKRSIVADPDNVIVAVKATIALHNFLRTEEMSISPELRRYCPLGFVDSDEVQGDWRSSGTQRTLENLRPNTRNNSTIVAKRMRNNLANFFMGIGRVAWQYERAYLDLEEVGAFR